MYFLPVSSRGKRSRLVICAGIGLWLVFFLGEIYGGGENGPAAEMLELAAMHWMGSVFLLAVGFFVADLACGFGFLTSRPTAGKLRTSGLILGLILVVVAHVQGLRPPVIENYRVEVADLPAELNGTTVAVMADLHAGEMLVGPEWINARVEQVLSLKPDLILLAGDLFERGSNPREMVPAVKRLSAPLGVWAVRGNHDTPGRHRSDVNSEILKKSGIRILENEWQKTKTGLVIAGIEDLTASRRHPQKGRANLESALARRPKGPSIFLSHTPWLTSSAAKQEIDLMFSGHTHNGQIWPFKYLVRTRYPHVCGQYQIEGMSLIVNRGTGTWGPRMRLWSPGEISLVTLLNPGAK